MKCGKTDLCDVETIKGKYQVTWGRHITSLDLFSEKVFILFDMIVKDMKGWEVGIMLSNGYVLWLKGTLIATLDRQTIIEYVRQCGNISDPNQVKGAVFDNIDDAETFIDRLEKKYIVYLLKK
jgi:hypothetical protein